MVRLSSLPIIGLNQVFEVLVSLLCSVMTDGTNLSPNYLLPSGQERSEADNSVGDDFALAFR